MANTDMSSTAYKTELAADQLSHRTDEALRSARRTADGAINALHDKVEQMNETIPGALSRAAAKVDEITRRGVGRARDTSLQMRDQVTRAGDRTVSYIKDEPLKSVLIAAAAGATMAAVISLLSRPRRNRY